MEKLNEISIEISKLRRPAAWKFRIPDRRVASCRVVARIPRTAPLSSNYRSNGASLGVDPTPASICRLALIQLPRRQLPRWYTCGRFIASTVIRVRHSPLFSTLSLSLSFPFPNTVPLTYIAILLPRSIHCFCYASMRYSFRVPRCEVLLGRVNSTEHEKFTTLSPIVFPRLAFFWKKFGFVTDVILRGVWRQIVASKNRISNIKIFGNGMSRFQDLFIIRKLED